MEKKRLTSMPTYSQKINVPAGFHKNYLYIRYYSAWGEGDREHVYPLDLHWPDVITDDNNGKHTPLKLYSPSPYVFSQYAAVKIVDIPDPEKEKIIFIMGYFEQAGYCSLTLYCENEK